MKDLSVITVAFAILVPCMLVFSSEFCSSLSGAVYCLVVFASSLTRSGLRFWACFYRATLRLLRNMHMDCDA